MSLLGWGRSSEPEESNEEYYVAPSDDSEDYVIHTTDHPFCDDMSCPCHEDSDNIEWLGGYYQGGLVSSDDADRIYRGQTRY